MSRSVIFYGLVIVGVAVLRIVAISPQLSQTSDEPSHVARGLEILENRDHFGALQHPPLPRLLAALPLYLSGARVSSPVHPLSGERALRVNGDYVGNLSRSRAMLLPYFLLACLALWILASRLFGTSVALLSVALFTMLPMVLGHAGVVGTDIAGTASFLLLIVALIHYLEKREGTRFAVLVGAFALTLLSKYSALFFAAPIVVSLFLFKEMRQAKFWRIPSHWLWKSALFVLVVAWASYLFRVRPLWQAIYSVEAHSPVPPEVALWPSFAQVSMFPLTDFFRSLLDIVTSKEYPPAYLFGKESSSGFYLGLPVALFLKTPLSFLSLSLLGSIAIWKTGRLSDWRVRLLFVAAASVLSVGVLSKINMGVRHLLPLFPFLAIFAAFAVSYLWKRNRDRPFVRFGLSSLLVWGFVDSLSAHPHYAVYFNEVARDRSGEVFNNSDVDFGQGVGLLAKELKERQIPKVGLAIVGFSPTQMDLGFPRVAPVPCLPTAGWFAVSRARLNVPCVTWLKRLEPVTLIANTIRLYRVTGLEVSRLNTQGAATPLG